MKGKWSRFFLLAGGLIVLFASIKLFVSMGHFTHQNVMNPGPRGHHFGHRGGVMHFGGQAPLMHHPKGMYPIWGSFWMLALILKLGVILTGLIVWKMAKENRFLKWLGGLLFVGGVYFLLPTALGILFLLVVAYVLWKSTTRKEMTFAHEDHVNAGYTIDYLDEWEKKIRKEEN
jgi:hypothetical protein